MLRPPAALRVWTACLLSGVLCPAHSVPAQGPAKRGPPLAALVGLRVRGPEHGLPAFRYETWLIVRDDSGTRVAARLDDIVVPRADGFWRVGVQAVCQFTPPDSLSPTGDIFREDMVYAAPIAERPATQVRPEPCDPHTAARVLAPSYDPDAAGPTPVDAPRECDHSLTWLEGVVPNLLSVGSYLGEARRDDCDPRDQYWIQYRSVLATDYLDSTVTLERTFGAAARAEWDRVIGRALRKEAGRDPCDGVGVPERDGGTTDWFFAHTRGAWHVLAYVQPARGRCVLEGDLGLQMPSRLTGEAATFRRPASEPPPAKDVSRDEWVSPGGGLLIYEESEGTPPWQLRVHEVGVLKTNAGTVGRKVLGLRAGHVVMVQWATGRYVKRWVAVLRDVQRHGLPTPAVTPAPAAPAPR